VAGAPSLERALVMNWDGRDGQGRGLPRALPHPNVLGGQPENCRECEACIRPVPHQCLGPARLAPGPISVKNTPNPNYISISLWGSFFSPVLCGLVCVPQVGEANGSASQPLVSHSARAVAQAPVPRLPQGA
jgi:hypothetical protein